MYVQELEELGLTHNEAIIYSSLLKHKSAPAGLIIKESKLHRNIVYENLEKLIEKGLVSFILEGKRKVFQVASPYSIIEMIEKEKEKIFSKEEIANNLKEKIDKQILDENIQEATIFRGVKGIKAVMDLTLKLKTDYVVMGAPKQSVEIMPPVFWENFNKKVQKEGIKVKMLFNESLRDWSKNIRHKMNEIKFLPKKFDSLTETNICADYVLIFIWSNPPLIIAIKDKNLSNDYMKYFDFLWSSAKP